ncbi:hypothetical protein HDU78_001057 [Chytriomyces hyalinus]|nr:hypothetical protein HDU78_001057 [Chytriomyces hyalinus]
MSLFNQLAYYFLLAEMATFLILLVPLNFIPIRARKTAMEWAGLFLANETIVWLARIVLLAITGVFADTLVRLVKLDSDLHARSHAEGHYDSPMAELQFKAKLFYSQRNMYLSLSALFMTLVLYRRVKDLYLVLILQFDNITTKASVSALEKQLAAVRLAPAAAAAEHASAAAPVDEADILASVLDPSGAEGLRKRS